jgi:outer membrane protein assembly factor BamB
MRRAAPAFLMTGAIALAAGFPASRDRAAALADGPSPAAAAEAAAERGWFGLARELCGLWQQGGADEIGTAAFHARLDAVEREVDLATRDRGRGLARRWAAGTCRTLWQHDISGASMAGPPLIAGDLVLWSTGAAIHAVGLADGLPAWPTGAAGRDTRLFPRGIAAAPNGGLGATASPGALCAAGGRAYAVLDSGAHETLVCLDLTPAAEGRLVWLVDLAHVDAAGLGLPDGPLVCDGPPLVDHELCCVVLRPAGGRDELVLAAFGAADGRLEWTRRCGTAIAADGVDSSQGRRCPLFVEDRIVLATHAGAVVAFDRDGRPAWRTETPMAAARAVETTTAARLSPLPPALPGAVAAGGLAIVALRDAGGVVAIEVRGGAVAWRRTAGDAVIGLLGPVEDGVVVVTRAAGDATGLVRLDRSSGREAVPPVALPGRSVGDVALVDHTLFHPRARMQDPGDSGIVLDVFDPVTLASRSLAIDVAPSAMTADGAASACVVAGGSGTLAVSLPGAITCLEGAASAADAGGPSR